VFLQRTVLRVSLAAVLLVALCVSSGATAKAISSYGSTTVKSIQSQMRMAVRFKKPQCFGAGVTGSSSFCQGAQKNFASRVRSMLSKIRQIPAGDRQDPAVITVTKEVMAMKAFGDDWLKGHAAAKAGSGKAKKQCEDFHKQVMLAPPSASADDSGGGRRGRGSRSGGSTRQSQIAPLLNAVHLDELKDKTGQTGLRWQQPTATQIEKVVAVATEVAAACEDPKWKGVAAGANRGACSWLRIKWADDPALWCRAAANVRVHVAKAIQARIQSDMDSQGGRGLSPEQSLQNKDGWYGTGPKTWKGDMFLSERSKDAMKARYKALFDAADMEFKADPSWYAKLEAQLAQWRAAINKLAGTWKSPGRSGKKTYGFAIAKKMIKESLKGQGKLKFYKAWMGDKNWHVAMSYGKPESRTWFGYTLFKVQGEKWCQLQQWQLEETYKGSKSYQRINKVTFTGNRYQKCR
jgi:hypothetical protein